MTAEQRGRAFDRFWRAGPPGTGTGLGLAIVRQLVEHDGGRRTAAGEGGGLEVTSPGRLATACQTLTRTCRTPYLLLAGRCIAQRKAGGRERHPAKEKLSEEFRARRIRLAVTGGPLAPGSLRQGAGPARPRQQEIAGLFDQWNTALRGTLKQWLICTPRTGYCCRP